MLNAQIAKYILFIADNNFIFSHRLAEICGHGPMLEEDIALSNISLDLLGQANLFYELAGELLDKTADDLVYYREATEFYNFSLLELPHKDYSHTQLVIFWYSIFYSLLLEELKKSTNNRISEISSKAILEVNNHIQHSKKWVKIFLNGTDESKARIKSSFASLLPYLLNCFSQVHIENALLDNGIVCQPSSLKDKFFKKIDNAIIAFTETDINSYAIPINNYAGEHTEYLGYILAECQSLAREFPNSKW